MAACILMQSLAQEVIPRGYGCPTGGIHRNTPQCAAGGNEESLPVRASESTIGNVIHRYRNEIKQHACGRNDINTPLELVSSLVWRVRFVETGCHVQTARIVNFDAIWSAAGVPIEDQFAAVGLDRAVRAQLKPPQLAHCTD